MDPPVCCPRPTLFKLPEAPYTLLLVIGGAELFQLLPPKLADDLPCNEGPPPHLSTGGGADDDIFHSAELLFDALLNSASVLRSLAAPQTC